MLIKIFLVHCIKLVAPLDLSPGRPVPHAKVLRKILKANLMSFSDTHEGSLVDYLFHAKELSNKTDNFDVDVLDIVNIRKIIAVAMRKYNAELPKDSRKRRETLQSKPYIIDLATRQMQQSIYATRYRLQTTLNLRKHYGGDVSYQIAILIGSIQQIALKMDNLLAQMKFFPNKSHFLWFLMLYEKLLAGNIDITLMVKRVFQLHDEYMTRFKDLQNAAASAAAAD